MTTEEKLAGALRDLLDELSYRKLPFGTGLARKTNLARAVLAAYDAQPKREPLTDSRMWNLAREAGLLFDRKGSMQFGRAVERAHEIGDTE